MTTPPLRHLAARARQALGTGGLREAVAETIARLERTEARLAALEASVAEVVSGGYPRGPLYLGDHTALVATRWGGRLLIDTRDATITPWLALDGMWEPHVTGWLHETLRPGQVFVDVGANVGYFTVLGARLVGPTGRVVAVEAHPRLAELLTRNTVVNGHYGYVTCWNRAAWSADTDLQFLVRRHFAGNSSAGSVPDLARFADHEDTITVPAVRLDELLAGLPAVDVVKMDVEGAEVQALTGMRGVLEANPRVVVMVEWAPAQIESVGDSPAALVRLLQDMRFKLRLLETGEPVDGDELLELPYGNVVASR